MLAPSNVISAEARWKEYEKFLHDDHELTTDKCSLNFKHKLDSARQIEPTKQMHIGGNFQRPFKVAA